MVCSLFFLDFKVKRIFATGTGGIMLAFDLREAEGGVAGGTFPVRMGFTVTPFVALQAEKVLDFANNRQILLVLR